MKSIKNILVNFSLLLLIFSASCQKNRDGCVDKSLISDGPCTLEYNPVCGCNGKTYSNLCAASKAGVIRTTPGVCQ